MIVAPCYDAKRTKVCHPLSFPPKRFNTSKTLINETDMLSLSEIKKLHHSIKITLSFNIVTLHLSTKNKTIS